MTRLTAWRVAIEMFTLLSLIACDGATGVNAPASTKVAAFGARAGATAAPPSGALLTYHGGGVLLQMRVVAIYWASSPIFANGPTPGTVGLGSTDSSLVGYFLNHLSHSNYWSINTNYSDGSGQPIQNVVTYARYWANNADVPPSDGSSVGIYSMLMSGFENGKIVFDPSTVYVVFTAGSTNLGGGFDESGYCALHGWMYTPYGTLLYAEMPYQLALADKCANSLVPPNNDPGADAEVNELAHELDESATDPLLNAWYFDGSNPRIENGDLCFNVFLSTYTTTYGRANVRIGAKDFYIQSDYLNDPVVGCTLGLVHTGLYVTSVSGVPIPVKSAGAYTLNAGPLSIPSRGAPLYQWAIAYSNGVLPPDTTEYTESRTFTLNVPAGSYSILVTVTPRDDLGVGAPTTWTLPVCTGGGQLSASNPDVLSGC
ncbi:MAG TPA: hypothetical protein VFI39_04345 [Gemmatimonadales bacterium]|nr:hypothetical protein [Gemmatimonadales bacterium]